MNPDIFKAYDIRGLYGSEMDGDIAELIGRGFARVLGRIVDKPTAELEVGLGRDMRLQSPEIAARIRDGLTAEGVRVLDIGLVASEILYYLVGSRRLDGGAMVTASHNPKAYTGVKLLREGALPLSGDAGIPDVRREIEAGLPDPPGGGSCEQADVEDEFHDLARSFVDPDKIGPLRVVVDAGNGMAGAMMAPLLEQLDLDLVETYWAPNGEFPDHEPNPLLPENRSFIMERVLAEGAGLGIAWDGDADRCFFIDDNGEFVPGDFVCALLAISVLRAHPGATILYDVRASRAVVDTVREHGGTPTPNRVGHAFFKQGMRDHDAMFGGEVSGHYYFRDFYCADSGTIPALLMLEHVSQPGTKMSEVIAALRARYFISGEINSEVSDQQGKMEEIAARYSDGEIGWLDGVSVDYPDWHFNVRASNTEPLLRLNLESLISNDHMCEKRDEVLELIRP